MNEILDNVKDAVIVSGIGVLSAMSFPTSSLSLTLSPPGEYGIVVSDRLSEISMISGIGLTTVSIIRRSPNIFFGACGLSVMVASMNVAGRYLSDVARVPA